MTQHRSAPAQLRTGIHGGVGRGAAAAAIGAVLVFAAGAPAAKGTLIPVPTVPATPPGGLIQPPLGIVMPPRPAPTADSPAAPAPVPAPTTPATVPGSGTAAPSAAPAVAPAASADTSAAAVRPASAAATRESGTAEAAAGANKAAPERGRDGAAGQAPNLVLAGSGLALLAVAAAAGVAYARLRGAQP
ncbi:hypothetical protein ACIQCM_04145 [Pseudarthrobacter sp. NPDC092439]|uniref:hypothetical protein n=1 Tax=unclassified Pseudarthrobacter TaxID=2647000 RepID=UPI0037FD35BE